MGDKTDLRVERTQKNIRRSFVDLLLERSFQDISVKDIAQRAEINRKTFYSYYENKEILYDEIVTDVFNDLCGCFLYVKQKEPTRHLDRDALRSDVAAFLSYLEERREDLSCLLHPTIYPMWFPILESTVITRRKTLFIRTGRWENKGDIPFKLYVDTITSLFVIWIYWWLSQEESTLEEGTEHLCRMLTRSMSNIFRYNKPEIP